MKIYIDENDIGKTVTYKEENGKIQYLYVHDNEGFIFKDLSDYTKQVRKEVCESIKEQFEKKAHLSLGKVGWEYQITEDEFDEFLEEIQGE